jgi:hypothetical protein
VADLSYSSMPILNQSSDAMFLFYRHIADAFSIYGDEDDESIYIAALAN